MLGVVLVLFIVFLIFAARKKKKKKEETPAVGLNAEIKVGLATSTGIYVAPPVKWALSVQKRLAFVEEQVSFIHGISDEAKAALIKKLMSEEFYRIGYLVLNDTFEKYFSSSTWTWEEFEFFRKYEVENKIFSFDFQRNYKYLCDVDEVTLDNVFDYISLPKAKKALEQINVDVPTKQIRKGIVEMARNDKNIETAVLDVYCRERQRFVFFSFVSTLRSRILSYNTSVKSPDIDWGTNALGEPDELIELGKKAGFTKYSPFIPCGTDYSAPTIQ